MSETFSATDKPCPNCGGIVAVDSRFCKNCAFDFAVAPQPLPQTNASGDRAPGRPRYAWLAVGLAAAMVLAFVAVWFYRSRHSAAPPAAATNQTMTDKAKQVEAKILQGATVANAELTGLSSYELRVLRNVHFARYGRVYDRPGLGDYFYTRPWYKPSGDYNDKLLSSTDKTNISLILAEENKAKAAEATQVTGNSAAAAPAPSTPASSSAGASSGGIVPSSSSGVLSDEQVQAILKAAYQHSPVEPTFGYMLDRVSNVSVEILRRGEYNAERKYLPVQARVTADIRQKAGYVPHDKPAIINCKLTDTADFMIVKNDYGDWQAGKTPQSVVFGKPKLQCGQ